MYPLLNHWQATAPVGFDLALFIIAIIIASPFMACKLGWVACGKVSDFYRL
jgi:hypothetical protein